MADRDLGACHRLARSHHPPRCHQLQHFKTLILSFLSHVTPPVCQEPCCQCLLGTHIFFLFSDFQAATGFWTKTEKLASPSTTYCIFNIGWGIRCSCCGHTFKSFPLKWWIISSDVICPRWCSVHEAGRQAGRQAVKLDAWFILHLGSSANQCEGTTLVTTLQMSFKS